MKQIPLKKYLFTYILSLGILGGLSIVLIWALLDLTIEKEDIFLVSTIFFIFPFFLYLSFRSKTRFIRKIDPDNIDTSTAEKIYNIKRNPPDYYGRIQYFFSEGFDIGIFIAHFFIPWLGFSLLGIFIYITENYLPSDVFIPFLIFIIALSVFLGLIYGSMKKIYSKIDLKKFLENSFSYIMINSLYLVFVIIILILFFDLIGGKIKIPYLAQFLKSNPSLAGKYISIAQISLLLFTGSFIVLGIMENYFSAKQKLGKKFEEYGEILQNKYKNYLQNSSSGKKDFSNFLLEYLEMEEKFLDKGKIAYFQRFVSIFRIMIKYLKVYAFIGVLFLLFSLGELETSGQGDITFDSILLLILIWAIFLQSIELGWVFSE